MKPLSPSQLTMLELLASRQQVTDEQFIQAIYAHKPECDWPEYPKECIDIWICKLRKWLGHFGIEIKTCYASLGEPTRYYIFPLHRDKVRYVVDGYQAIVTYPDPRQMELFAHG